MTKTTTTTREYDDAGNMVKETVTTVEDSKPVQQVVPIFPIYPRSPGIYDYRSCRCAFSTWCPVHPATPTVTWTSNLTGKTVGPAEVAQSIAEIMNRRSARQHSH